MAFASTGVDYSQWSESAVIKLNTSSAGANIPGNVLGFPLLLRLDNSNFDFSLADAKGKDIRVSDAAGRPLSFEIERWDCARRLAEIWIRIDTVNGNCDTQTVRLRWGNPNASSASSGPSVFPAYAGFQGVWHLETNGTSGHPVQDASEKANHGTGQGSPSPQLVAGAIGQGLAFDSHASIRIQSSPSLHIGEEITLELWANASVQGPFKRLAGRASSSTAFPWTEYDIETDSSGRRYSFCLGMNANILRVTGTTIIAPKTWYHVVGTYDGATMRIYVNGSLENSLDYVGFINDYGRPLIFGKYEYDDFSGFSGKLDEVRISDGTRSPDWIKLSYANQRADQKLYSGPIRSLCEPSLSVSPDTSVPAGGLVQLTAVAECASGYYWEAVSGPAPKILDPEGKSLTILLPRVERDTLIEYRVTAKFPATSLTHNVKVTVIRDVTSAISARPVSSANPAGRFSARGGVFHPGPYFDATKDILGRSTGLEVNVQPP